MNLEAYLKEPFIMAVSENAMDRMMKILLPRQAKVLTPEERAVLSDFLEQLGLNQEQRLNALFALEPGVVPMRMVVDGARAEFADRNGRVLFTMRVDF